MRSLVSLLPEAGPKATKNDTQLPKPTSAPEKVYDLVSLDGQKQFDVRDLLGTIIDKKSADEYKADYGKTLVTTYARIGGRAVGIVANQRLQVRTKKDGIQMGGVIYPDSADKAARFIMTLGDGAESPEDFLADSRALRNASHRASSCKLAGITRDNFRVIVGESAGSRLNPFLEVVSVSGVARRETVGEASGAASL